MTPEEQQDLVQIIKDTNDAHAQNIKYFIVGMIVGGICMALWYEAML